MDLRWWASLMRTLRLNTVNGPLPISSRASEKKSEKKIFIICCEWMKFRTGRNVQTMVGLVRWSEPERKHISTFVVIKIDIFLQNRHCWYNIFVIVPAQKTSERLHIQNLHSTLEGYQTSQVGQKESPAIDTRFPGRNAYRILCKLPNVSSGYQS